MTDPLPSLVPERFGPLQGVRILSTGTIIAQPFAAALAAQVGAEVIQVERPGAGDVAWRTLGLTLPTRDGTGSLGCSWVQERRNTLHVSLDLSRPEARPIFLKLLSWAEVWMESSRPGSYARWGFDDDTVLRHNPRLVVTHVSGFGQAGHADYLSRPSYDMIGQAFGGMLQQTGFPDPSPPTRAAPWTGDYITALFALWATLAAYIHASKTGQGQSIDIAQFEAIHHVLNGTMVEFFQQGAVRERSGNRSTVFQPYDTFEAQDGWLVAGTVGPTVFERACRVVGLDAADPRWQRARTEVDTPDGRAFDRIFRSWVHERTVEAVIEAFNAAGVPCCRIMDSRAMASDPHYQERGQIWRGSVPVGHDNDKVYRELLGLTADDLAGLRESGVI
jgi:crotonobetainyl-CoA:carnitine CoA-transferase CaiB-like acyl-CoA transferase